MKICVYTICKNEEQFVDRFMDSVQGADMVIITDTGSTDNSVVKLEARGAIVHSINISPWRFDVARNISLSFVPDDVDICVCVDMDEILSDGWADAIRNTWQSDTTRMLYKYIWRVNPDGSEGLSFWYDKIHARNQGYSWIKPVHEILTTDLVENRIYCYDFILKHYPDVSKSRSSYLPLLEMACQEEPLDDRSSHYLGREFMYYREYDKCIMELKRHLSLDSSTWVSERAASMRYIAYSYKSLGDFESAHHWNLRACAEQPNERENWIDLAKLYFDKGDDSGVLYAVEQALKIIDQPMSYMNEDFAWNDYPYELASNASYNLGYYHKSLYFNQEGMRLFPNNHKFSNNVDILSKYLNISDSFNI